MKKILLSILVATSTLSEVFADPELAVLHSFNFYNEGKPSSNLLLTEDDKLIGHTDSYIYELLLNTTNTPINIIQEAGRDSEGETYFFEGDLTSSKDKQFLYGVKTSFTRGEIFKISADGKFSLKLHEVSIKNYDEGYDLEGGLVLSLDERFLYGVTQSGGKANQPRSTSGVVYKLSLDLQNPRYTVLHSFNGKNSHDGGAPVGSLALSPDGEYLYGITTTGGATYCGTLFQIDLKNNNSFKTIHSFDCTNEAGSNNGGKPNNIIISKDGGFIYGTSYKTNWDNNTGIVFKVDLTTNNYPLEVLHEFNIPDGILPESIALNQNDTRLYGITSSAGLNKNNYGTIFSISLQKEDYHYMVLHTFDQENGPKSPIENFTLNPHTPIIYGLTEFGGEHDTGTVYKFDVNNFMSL